MKKVFLFICCMSISFLIMFVYGLWKQNMDLQRGSGIPKTQFSLANAPGSTLLGNISSVSGYVDWQSRIASKPSRLITIPQIQQGEELDTESTGNSIVQFPNAGTVAISPNTHVSFIQTLPANLVIAQTQGTATYTITGKVPLSINSLDLLLTLNTGECTVTTATASATITVTIMHGFVTAAFNDAQNVSNVIPVQAGNQFIFDDTTKQGVIQAE